MSGSDVESVLSSPLSAVISPGFHLTARGIGHTVRSRSIMQDVSLVIEPGELVAIIGASGAGKTTLLTILAGLLAPTVGTVQHNSQSSGGPTATDSVPGSIGYVPQEDIIHRDITLGRVLRYAAKLRLPANTADREISHRVNQVLSSLGLTDRAHDRVATLSGGERKRASIAVELLTEPVAIFLDEPTSGLDPATASGLIRLCREFTAKGATVVLTTHSPADAVLCDKIVVLTDSGRLAFSGPPRQALDHFQVDSIAGIYQQLADDPVFWLDRAPSTEPEELVHSGRATVQRLPRSGFIRQFRLLTVRNLDILVHNRLTLLILLGSPVAIVLMFLMLFTPGAFDFANPSPNTTVMTLFWIAFGGFFFGLTYGLSQICDEFPILRRERFAGLRIGPYILAKLAALLPLLVLVDLLFIGVLEATNRLPALKFSDSSALFTTVLLDSFCALTLGLLASASVKNPAQATLMLPMLCFPQVLFVGALLPVPVMADGGQLLSYLMSNRWSFEALGHIVNLDFLWRNGGSPLGPPLLASYGNTFTRPVWADWAILVAGIVVFLAATWSALAGKTRLRQRT